MGNIDLVPTTSRKCRVNISIDSDVLARIDRASQDFGVSRSSFIEYCFELWSTLYNGTVSKGSND